MTEKVKKKKKLSPGHVYMKQENFSLRLRSHPGDGPSHVCEYSTPDKERDAGGLLWPQALK